MPNESERNMKDFSLRNDTRLPIRNDSVPELAALCADRRMLLVYGDGSVKEAGQHVPLAGIDAPETFEREMDLSTHLSELGGDVSDETLRPWPTPSCSPAPAPRGFYPRALAGLQASGREAKAGRPRVRPRPPNSVPEEQSLWPVDPQKYLARFSAQDHGDKRHVPLSPARP